MRLGLALVVFLASLSVVAGCGGSEASPGPSDGSAETSIKEGSVADVAHVHDAGAETAADTGPDVMGVPEGGGVPISENPNEVNESEDQIAVAPDGTIGFIWTAYDQTGNLIMGYRFSANDGASFSPVQFFAMPAGYSPGDPAITTDAQGNFYASMLGIHFTAGQNIDEIRVYSARAPAGSTTFGAPVEVTDPATTVFCDHPKIHVLSTGAITVTYMMSTTLTSATSSGVLASSPDGTAWTRSTIVTQPDADFSNLFWTCEGTGVLYVTYLEFTATAGYVALRTSTDHGATWSHPSTVVSLATESVAANDPICVASGTDVWVLYTTTPTPTNSSNNLDPAHTMPLAHSANSGVTFDAARVDTLDTKASALGLLPLVLQEPAGGALDVVYLAGKVDMDPQGTVRYARAATGTTFGPSTVIDGPMLFTSDRTMPTWVGDYFGAVIHGTSMYVAYPMNSSGADHIYFRKVALP
jgi:hypothetical protein